MDSSSAQHHQEMGANSLENMLVCSKSQQERKPKPQPEQALKCPRCDSINTKFCYYNNYSLSQPRYFCKSCRRYWTKGGTLRNVPVGGGCRKNKRPFSSSPSSRKNQDLNPNTNPLLTTLPPSTYDSNDLTLGFARLQKLSTGQLGFDDQDLSILGNPIGNPNPPFLDNLRNGFLENSLNNDFQNLFYHNGYGGEMMVPNNYNEDIISGSYAGTQAVTVTTIKQELCNNETVREDEGKILWGFPWQINGIGDDFGSSSSARESWNSTGIGSTNWHGVLNSPLM